METFEKITKFLFAVLFCGALVLLALDTIFRRWLAERRRKRAEAGPVPEPYDRRRRPRPSARALDWEEAPAGQPLRPTRLMPKPSTQPRATGGRISW
jgi:hypothetical protein